MPPRTMPIFSVHNPLEDSYEKDWEVLVPTSDPVEQANLHYPSPMVTDNDQEPVHLILKCNRGLCTAMTEPDFVRIAPMPSVHPKNEYGLIVPSLSGCDCAIEPTCSYCILRDLANSVCILTSHMPHALMADFRKAGGNRTWLRDNSTATQFWEQLELRTDAYAKECQSHFKLKAGCQTTWKGEPGVKFPILRANRPSEPILDYPWMKRSEASSRARDYIDEETLQASDVFPAGGHPLRTEMVLIARKLFYIASHVLPAAYSVDIGTLAPLCTGIADVTESLRALVNTEIALREEVFETVYFSTR